MSETVGPISRMPQIDTVAPLWPIGEGALAPELAEYSGDIADVETRSTSKLVGHIAARSAQWAGTLVQFPVLHDAAKYVLLAGVYADTGSPLKAGVIYGATSFALETVGAVSSAPLLGTDTVGDLAQKTNDFIGRHKKDPESPHVSKPLKIAVAVYAGTTARMLIEKEEKPGMTTPEIRRFGLKTAAWVGGMVCTAEGIALSEGVNVAVDDPKILIPAGIGAATAYLWRRMRRQRRTANSLAVSSSRVEATDAAPRYDLSAEELAELEAEMVAVAREKHPQKGIVGIWVNPSHKFANFVRAHEASYFSEVEEVSEDDEANTLFYALVDTRQAKGRVVHGATVTGIHYDKAAKSVSAEVETASDSTGMYTIDSLIELGNFTAEEFRDYYAAKGLNPDASIAVETNFRIGDKVPKYHGFSTPELAYYALFHLLERTGPKKDNAAVFASINRASIVSFDRTGMIYEPVMGRTDMVTEESLQGKDSLPVILPYTRKNRRLFGLMRLRGARLPELFM